MKWLVVLGAVAGGLALVAGIVALVGSQLSRSHVASGEVEVPPTPETVWKVITDIDAYPTWRANVTRVERAAERSGPVKWVEHGSDGVITFVVDRADPPRLLIVRIADRDLPFGGTWTYDISRTTGGTRVTITERGEIYNPIFRFMARFVFGYEGSIKTYLSSLEKKLAAAR